MQKTVITDSPEATERLAETIGQKLRGGEVIELASDLGGGKTTFARGLVRGLDSSDAVASPTFTISRQYSGGRLEAYHYDFYRLTEAGLIAHELHDALQDEKGVVVVEWSDVVAHVLPQIRMRIKLENTNEHSRKITLEYPEELAHLVGNI